MALLAGISFTSCNKNIPDPTPISYPVPTTASIGELLNNPSFSYLRAAVNRLGLMPTLMDKNTKFTVFAPDNSAFNRLFAALRLPQAEATVGALPLTTLAPIVQYHVVPGQTLSSSMIPETYPNTFMPTLLQASPSPLLKLVNFPSRRGGNAFVNEVRVSSADIAAANGVVHIMAGVIVPPNTTTILQALQADTSYTFLLAAINRADQGLPNNSKVVQLLGNATPYANFTLFAPPNNAFRAFYRALGNPNPTAAFANSIPVNTILPIVAYHVHIRGVLGTPPNVSPDLIRVFSTNLPSTPTQATSFLSMLSPTAPRLTISASTGVKGTGNPVPAAITRPDWHNLNGVIHVINQVLRPQ